MYEVLFAGFTRHLETEALLRAGEPAAAAEDVRRFEERAGSNRRYGLAALRARAALAGSQEETVAVLEQARSLADAIGLPGEQW